MAKRSAAALDDMAGDAALDLLGHLVADGSARHFTAVERAALTARLLPLARAGRPYAHTLLDELGGVQRR